MKYLVAELNLHYPDPEGDRNLAYPKHMGIEISVLDAVALATPQMRGPFQNVEFLAKRLAFGSIEDVDIDKRILLATPLYVAMAD